MSRRQKKLAGETPEVQEVEMHGISVEAEYQRQINMSAHGGVQYETTVFKSKRSCSVLTREDAKLAYKLLYQDCFEEVEETIKAFDQLMAGEVAEQKKAKKKSEPTDEIGLSQEEVTQIAPLINKLVAANSTEELSAVGDEIDATKAELNENQLSYLRLKYNAKGKLLKK